MVIISPRSVNNSYNSTVNLTCEVQSLTTPNVTWKSNTDVTLPSTSLVSNNDIHISNLTLEQLTLEYIGEYTCTAENEGGKMSDMTRVDVHGKYMSVSIHLSVYLSVLLSIFVCLCVFLLLCVYVPMSLSLVPLPVVTISPRSVNDSYNSLVTLTCEVHSLTTPNVTWKSNTDVTLPSTSLVSNNDIHISNLTLEQVTLEYIGEYTCSAENEGGEMSDMIRVDVYGKKVCVSIDLSVCLLVQLIVFIILSSFYLSVCLSVCLFVCFFLSVHVPMSLSL